MPYMTFALSWDYWIAANAEVIAMSTVAFIACTCYWYRGAIRTRLERTRLGIKLGLIGAREQDTLIRKEKLSTLLNKLKEIFERTKQKSGRHPEFEAFDLDPEKALKGREKKFSLILDQIKRIALRVIQLQDINEILEIRMALESAVKDLGTISTSDVMAVDNQEAVVKLNELLTDLDEAVAEIERAEDEAMDDDKILASWSLQGEEEEETENDSGREPLKQIVERKRNEPPKAREENNSEPEEDTPRQREAELA